MHKISMHLGLPEGTARRDVGRGRRLWYLHRIVGVLRELNIGSRIIWRFAHYMIRDGLCMFVNAWILFGSPLCGCWDVIRAGMGKSTSSSVLGMVRACISKRAYGKVRRRQTAKACSPTSSSWTNSCPGPNTSSSWAVAAEILRHGCRVSARD